MRQVHAGSISRKARTTLVFKTLLFLAAFMIFGECVAVAGSNRIRHYDDLEQFFPMRAGITRIYIFMGRFHEAETMDICGPTEHGGRMCSETSDSDMLEHGFTVYEIIGNRLLVIGGVNILTGELEKYEKPRLVLQSPLKKNMSWADMDLDERTKTVCKVTSVINKMCVQAGEFYNVIKIERNIFIHEDGKPFKKTPTSSGYDYYAKDIGLIKSTEKDGKVIRELVEFKNQQKN